MFSVFFIIENWDMHLMPKPGCCMTIQLLSEIFVLHFQIENKKTISCSKEWSMIQQMAQNKANDNTLYTLW